MAPSSRDRISVDLRGLKAALFESARAAGLTPSGFVREAVAASLQGEPVSHVASQPSASSANGLACSRLSLRVTQDQAKAIVDAARAAGMPLGAFVFELVLGVPPLADGASRRELLAALTATNAELASLDRNMHHLSALLRQGAWRAADEYRLMLATLSHDVRAYLERAARALGELRPPKQTPARPHQRT